MPQPSHCGPWLTGLEPGETGVVVDVETAVLDDALTGAAAAVLLPGRPTGGLYMAPGISITTCHKQWSGRAEARAFIDDEVRRLNFACTVSHVCMLKTEGPKVSVADRGTYAYGGGRRPV